jgi:hypothetical protein
MEFQRYSKVGYFVDDDTPCYLPDQVGDYIKLKSGYAYRPIKVDTVSANRYRLRSIVKRLVLVNVPTWFITLTFNDPAARSSIKDALAAGSLFLRRLRDVDCKALLVPEKDQNGNWHFHGFVFGNVPSHLIQVKRSVTTGKIMTRYIVPLSKKVPVFSSSLWETGKNNLGWDFWTRLNVSQWQLIKVANYTSKYVSKDFIASTQLRKRYLRSRGLSLDKMVPFDRYVNS